MPTSGVAHLAVPSPSKVTAARNRAAARALRDASEANEAKAEARKKRAIVVMHGKDVAARQAVADAAAAGAAAVAARKRKGSRARSRPGSSNDAVVAAAAQHIRAVKRGAAAPAAAAAPAGEPETTTAEDGAGAASGSGDARHHHHHHHHHKHGSGHHRHGSTHRHRHGDSSHRHADRESHARSHHRHHSHHSHGDHRGHRSHRSLHRGEHSHRSSRRHRHRHHHSHRPHDGNGAIDTVDEAADEGSTGAADGGAGTTGQLGGTTMTMSSTTAFKSVQPGDSAAAHGAESQGAAPVAFPSVGAAASSSGHDTAGGARDAPSGGDAAGSSTPAMPDIARKGAVASQLGSPARRGEHGYARLSHRHGHHDGQGHGQGRSHRGDHHGHSTRRRHRHTHRSPSKHTGTQAEKSGGGNTQSRGRLGVKALPLGGLRGTGYASPPGKNEPSKGDAAAKAQASKSFRSVDDPAGVPKKTYKWPAERVKPALSKDAVTLDLSDPSVIPGAMHLRSESQRAFDARKLQAAADAEAAASGSAVVGDATSTAGGDASHNKGNGSGKTEGKGQTKNGGVSTARGGGAVTQRQSPSPAVLREPVKHHPEEFVPPYKDPDARFTDITTSRSTTDEQALRGAVDGKPKPTRFGSKPEPKKAPSSKFTARSENARQFDKAENVLAMARAEVSDSRVHSKSPFPSRVFDGERSRASSDADSKPTSEMKSAFSTARGSEGGRGGTGGKGNDGKAKAPWLREPIRQKEEYVPPHKQDGAAMEFATTARSDHPPIMPEALKRARVQSQRRDPTMLPRIKFTAVSEAQEQMGAMWGEV